MTTITPTAGRIVQYTLSRNDAESINKRRADAQAHLVEHRQDDTGVQIHVGNAVSEGDVYPMMITRAWGTTPTSSVNGQVYLDGNDCLWVTSAQLGVGPRTFTWPVRN